MEQWMHFEKHSVVLLQSLTDVVDSRFFIDVAKCLEKSKHIWINTFLLDELPHSWKYALLFTHTMLSYKKLSMIIIYPSASVLEFTKRKEFVTLKTANTIDIAMGIQQDAIGAKQLNFFKSMLQITQFQLFRSSYIPYIRGNVFKRPKEFGQFTQTHNYSFPIQLEIKKTKKKINFICSFSGVLQEIVHEIPMDWCKNALHYAIQYAGNKDAMNVGECIYNPTNIRSIDLFKIGQTVVVPMVGFEKEIYLEFWIPYEFEEELLTFFK